MTVTRMLARPLLASTFLLGAANALKNSEALAHKAKPVTDRIVPTADKASPEGVSVPNDPQTLVRINAGVQILAASTFAIGKFPRASAAVLAASLIPTTVAGHDFWAESDPTTKQQQMLHFAKNASILGGLLLATVDTEGKPGLAWRAQRAAKDVRRSADTLGKQAQLQGRLAKSNVA